MLEEKSFTFRLVIIVGFFYVFYMFFVLATSIYQKHRSAAAVQSIADEVDQLRELDKKKPEEIAYFNSPQYKTLYAKESLGLYEVGEKILALNTTSEWVKQGEAVLMTDTLSSFSVLKKSYPVQWREYFFGQTLSAR